MNFPTSPTIDQQYTFGSKTWAWTGSAWKLINSSMSFRITEVASSVNYLDAIGGITGTAPSIKSEGADTNVGMNFSTKGTGPVRFFTRSSTSSGTNQVLQLEDLVSSVNFIALRGAVSNGNVEIEAKGVSSNIGVNIVTKGTGQLLVNGLPLSADGAKGGGPDKVFFENDIFITTDYTITTNKNAVTAGPITIDPGATITIPPGSVWTIV